MPSVAKKRPRPRPGLRRSVPRDHRPTEAVVHAYPGNRNVVVVREASESAIGTSEAAGRDARDVIVLVGSADIQEFGTEAPVGSERPFGAEACDPAPIPVFHGRRFKGSSGWRNVDNLIGR